jgi:hypothetical protein
MKSRKYNTKRRSSRKKNKKGGTIESKNDKLQAMNLSGKSDLKILEHLGITYTGEDGRIDLLHFFENPNKKTKGFNRTFLQALDHLKFHQLTELVDLLDNSYTTRMKDGEYHKGLFYNPDPGHAYMAAVTRWLRDRVSEYISPPAGKKSNIEADRELIIPYVHAFMNEFELQKPPPVPRYPTAKEAAAEEAAEERDN